ncbi:hypothetical protein HYPSUDRAFT_210076 [Hypholoma sublateritium FD-334 SS-4]|uniref:Uncharacterized protein n=1 Tax=Hypholoma sublateritium (strain FD-334 SS-4) TaxID=945553 RepID=A0A0D2NWA5_HYPSF|nr:hypothetical protein HYPSUDRAFT_210076 [Hypholoma sublateritium FD-334 SS-4]
MISNDTDKILRRERTVQIVSCAGSSPDVGGGSTGGAWNAGSVIVELAERESKSALRSFVADSVARGAGAWVQRDALIAPNVCPASSPTRTATSMPSATTSTSPITPFRLNPAPDRRRADKPDHIAQHRRRGRRPARRWRPTAASVAAEQLEWLAAEYRMRLDARPVTDAATPTHSTTAQHTPTFALRLRAACHMDKATRIAVLTVAAPHATDTAATANSAASQPVLLPLEYAERSAVAKRELDDTARST